MKRKTKGEKKMEEILNDFLPKLVVSTEEMDKYCGLLQGMYDYSMFNVICASMNFYKMYGKEPEKFAPYGRWKKVGRYVKKGEKASYMLRPQKYSYEYENENGEKEERTGISFKPFAVFDISQTDGEPLVQENLIKGKTTITPKKLLNFLEKEGYEVIETNKILQRGSTNSKYIKISSLMTDNEQISTAIHEYAHNLLKHFERKESRNIFEFEAETVAYMVTTALGLDNQKARLYINNWGGTAEDIGPRGRVLVGTANNIYEKIKKI